MLKAVIKKTPLPASKPTKEVNMTITTKTCSVDGCEKKLSAKDKCSMHYWRMAKYGAVELPERTKKLCMVSGCGGVVRSLGYCNKHYSRKYKYGRTERLHIDRGGSLDHPLNRTYSAMLDRCTNTNNPEYPSYGGRGITVCERWAGEAGFKYFVKDMGERPQGTTLDRINNNNGYSPDNCRWASNLVQSLNKRIRNDNKSGHTGVWYHAPSKRYHSFIKINGKRQRLGCHLDIQDAITARKTAEAKYYQPLLESAR